MLNIHFTKISIIALIVFLGHHGILFGADFKFININETQPMQVGIILEKAYNIEKKIFRCETNQGIVTIEVIPPDLIENGMSEEDFCANQLCFLKDGLTCFD
jgi:hypothetical protein